MAEIPFAFRIGGKDIDPSRADGDEAAVLNQIVESVIDRAGELVCPVHGEPPRFICSGPDLDNLSLEVEGCCEELIGNVRLRMTN